MKTGERMTASDFVKAAGLTMTSRPTDRNPQMESSGWEMDHWRVTLKCGPRRMKLVFSKGVGYGGAEPEINEVLDCLASDAVGIENAASFDEWASEYGYGDDRRKGERSFKVTQKQSENLKRLLGNENYETLLWKTGRE